MFALESVQWWGSKTDKIKYSLKTYGKKNEMKNVYYIYSAD